MISKHDLKRAVNSRGSEFFDRQTMRFFGDTMANYGVRMAVIIHDDKPIEVIELYRRRPVNYGLNNPAYFCPVTFERLYGVRAVSK